MLYSDDAPSLEHELHTLFKDRRMNRVNARREFFQDRRSGRYRGICEDEGTQWAVPISPRSERISPNARDARSGECEASFIRKEYIPRKTLRRWPGILIHLGVFQVCVHLLPLLGPISGDSSFLFVFFVARPISRNGILCYWPLPSSSHKADRKNLLVKYQL